ncbi:DUF2071 domain-containing protein [Neobacillus piezotolerans]|uniref:DUF2071 domain-containing protein n=1 Tax=Neobacillus piezotolerans TaxID=2259171 RepID=A0A3D8GTV9_9BACI|nr:DUF2071 domain-containing protein [Neobacillus piezotolerans]RDU37661.1 DUF2071 domain-containing protein [Neobacillus piezotolerans]
MDELLKETAHRPYPLPDAPWLMTQTWENLLFMHWPVDAALVRELVPVELELDTWDGEAWISISPFQVKHQRFRILPEIPMLNEYLELNVRTYVKRNGKQGVWFFSLDANLAPAVFAANGLLALPYKNAEMSFDKEDHPGEALKMYEGKDGAGANFNKKKGFRFMNSRITGEDWFGRFDCSYRPVSEPGLCQSGTLEHWLIERYCLFTTRDGKVLRGDIHHLPWDVSAAEASVSVNTMCPVPLPREPLLQYCESKKVLMFPFVED